MSKPTLGQIIELIKINSKSIGVVCDGVYEYMECAVAIEKFGDVEVKELECSVHTLASTRELTYNTNAIVEFNFKKDDEIIEVTIRRVMGSK